MNTSVHPPNRDLIDRLLEADRKRLLVISGAMLITVMTIDHFTGFNVSPGVLYVLPMLPVAVVFNRGGIIAFALLFGLLRLSLAKFESSLDSALRFGLSVVANGATGLFVAELAHNRRLVVEHNQQLQEHQALRREAEEHLRALAESSPAAILTVDERGRILSANNATAQLLGLSKDAGLPGHSIMEHLPVLASALTLDARSQGFRTATQCQGRRADGGLFVAQIWFSTYQTPQGRRLAAIAVDCSEEAREREEQNLKQLLDNNRIMACAVSHEVRNVCGAISLVYANLRKTITGPESEDFQALGLLTEALEKIAATELYGRSTTRLSPLDPREVLNHLRIVIEPSWEEAGGAVRWDLPESLPGVFGEAFGMTQAFLNLSQNSLRAVSHSARKELLIAARCEEGKLCIFFEDSGPGISEPQRLFEPFQQGAQNAGLGLYVSRAILRSYGGELRFEPSAEGCRFIAELETVAAKGVQAA